MKLLSCAITYAILATSASALGPQPPPKVDPTPTENFNWADPFSSTKLKRFDAACEAQKKFAASEYQLHDLFKGEPVGLWPYAEALKSLFSGREYPGGWDGIDNHGYERTLLKMTYSDIPVKVREWIEEQERTSGKGKGLYAVYEKPPQGEAAPGPAKVPKKELADGLRPLDNKKVAIFAPGALYETLPLWVAEGSDCKDTLLDLQKYTPKLADGAVVAWTPSHTKLDRMLDKREIEFTVKAQVLKAKAKNTQEAETKGDNTVKDEL